MPGGENDKRKRMDHHHYDKMGAMAVAKRAIQRGLNDPATHSSARLLRAVEKLPLDQAAKMTKTGTT
jgi:hypothetical protein